jgi:hypothetical protein
MEEGWEGNKESADSRMSLMMLELARDREVRSRPDFGTGNIVDQTQWHNHDINRGFQNHGVHRQADGVRFQSSRQRNLPSQQACHAGGTDSAGQLRGVGGFDCGLLLVSWSALQ